MTKTLLGSIAVFMFMTSMFIAGCGDETGPAAKSKEAPKVTVVHPVVRSLTDEADYNGWLEAYKTVDVVARVRGYITKVHFKDGDMVKEGTPLFDLDEAPFLAERAQVVAQSKALEAQQEAAEKVADRDRELIKSHAVSQQELDKSIADAKSYGAQIQAKKADADRIDLDLKYAKITAPLTGKIGKANLVEGAMVNGESANQVLTTIVTVDPIYVDFNVDAPAVQRFQQSSLGKAESQKPLRERNVVFHFGLDTEKGFPHEGRLVFSDIKFAEGTGTILVRGLAENKNGQLVPGARVRVRLPTSDKYAATLVPDEAVCTDQSRKYLLVVGADKNVKRVNVELGRLLDDGMRVITSSELKANTWIISEGMERARLNYPVEPVPESAEAVASTATGS